MAIKPHEGKRNMLVKFYNTDGTPVTSSRRIMVGGSQEDPEVEFRTEEMMSNCPCVRVGDVIFTRWNGGYSKGYFFLQEHVLGMGTRKQDWYTGIRIFRGKGTEDLYNWPKH